MKQAGLTVELTKAEREEMADRYHFERAQLPQITALYEAALPLLRVQACFETAAPAYGHERSVFCAVTLGETFDAMQALYSDAGAMSETYFLECIGNTLLEKACQRLGDMLREETGLSLERLEFPGTHIPMEQMADMIQALAAGQTEFIVTCSEVYVLRPKKSVVFRGILGETCGEQNICANCPRKECENRR